MLPKLVLGVVAAVAVGLFAQGASAHEPVRVLPGTGGLYVPAYPSYSWHVPPRVDYDYVVYMRHFGHWDRYGRFETLREAERVERHLEQHGHRARIEVVRDRHSW